MSTVIKSIYELINYKKINLFKKKNTPYMYVNTYELDFQYAYVTCYN